MNDNNNKRCGDVPNDLVHSFSNITIEQAKYCDGNDKNDCHKKQPESGENNPFKRLKTKTNISYQGACACEKNGQNQQLMTEVDLVIEGSAEDYYPISLGGDPGPNPHIPPIVISTDETNPERDDYSYYSDDSFDSFEGDDFDF